MPDRAAQELADDMDSPEMENESRDANCARRAEWAVKLSTMAEILAMLQSTAIARFDG